MRQKFVIMKNNKVEIIPQYELFYLATKIDHSLNGGDPVEKAINILEDKGYVVDTLAHAYMGNFGKTYITNGKENFKTINEASNWIANNKYSTASKGVISSTISRNLSGKTKSAYGFHFNYAKEKIKIDNIQKF